MDEMKIRFNSKIMCGMISRIISKIIYKKTKVKADVIINGISIERKFGVYHFHINADAVINEKDILKISHLTEEEAV